MVMEIERPATTAPYAPVHNVLNIIRRLREGRLPDPLTAQELERVGVPPGNAPRTHAALRFLGLVNEEGQRTEAFERVRRASTEEYPGVLGEVIRAAYEPVFTVADPAEDDETTIHDAFRHYQPERQRGRMVTLFLGLCREAGIISGGPIQRRQRVRRGTAERPPARTRPQVAREETPEPSAEIPVAHSDAGIDYRLISALMQQLPKDGKWTRSRRDRWVQTMTAAVDLLIEIVNEGGASD